MTADDFLRRVFLTDAPDEKTQFCWGGEGSSALSQPCFDRNYPANFYYPAGDFVVAREGTGRLGLCPEHENEILGGGEHEHQDRTA